MLKPTFLIATWLAPLCFAASLLVDTCVGADQGGCDEAWATDSSMAEVAGEDPYLAAVQYYPGIVARIRGHIETLKAESLRDSLDNLSDMTLFEWPAMAQADGGGSLRFDMPPGEGRHEINCILGNRRVLKLLQELAHLPSAEAGALVQEHLMAALSKYQSGFRKSYSPDKIGIVHVVNVEQLERGEVAAPATRYTPRYESLSLALIAGHLELESTFPAVLELAQYAREQREYLRQCYLTDKIPESRAYSILADASLYNRLVIPTALVGTSGAERKAALMQKLRSYDVPFTTEKLTTYDAFLTPHDIIVGPGRWPPDYSKGTIEVTFIRAFTDEGFDRVLAEVTK